MILEAAAISNVGNVRQNNEDNYILMRKILPLSHNNTKIATKRVRTKGRSIFGVFDGMGGYSNGEVASFLAAETAMRIFSHSRKCPVRETLAQICKEANLHICEEMQKQSQRIGTTAAMLSIHRSNAVVCNIWCGISWHCIYTAADWPDILAVPFPCTCCNRNFRQLLLYEVP